MASKHISDLIQFSGSLNGSELLMVQTGPVSRKVTLSEIYASASVSLSASSSISSVQTQLDGKLSTAAYNIDSASVSSRTTVLETGYVQNSQTASFATKNSNSFTGDQLITGNVTTIGSSSVVGPQTVSGSVNISGSVSQSGNNTLRGNSTILGNVNISGSVIQNGNNTILGVSVLSGNVNIFGDELIDGTIRFEPTIVDIDTSVSASYIYNSGSTNDLYFSQNCGGYSNVTRLRWMEGNLYTGVLSGGLLQQSGSTKFNVTSGSGIIVSMNASTQQEPYPTIKYVNWGNISSVTSSFITQEDQTFVGIDENGNVLQQGAPWTDGQNNSSLFLGIVLHQNRSTINGVSSFPDVAYGFKQRSYDFIKAFGALKLSGYSMLPSASSTGSLVIGSGTSWSDGRNYSIDPNNPSYISESGTTVSKIFRYYSSGSSFVYDTNGGAGYGAIDYARFNNNGTLTAVPGTGTNRQWQNQRVFWFPNSATKGIFVYYGTTTYTSQNEAIINLPYEQFTEAANTKNSAIYLGSLTIRNDADFTNTSTYKILPAGIFRSLGGSAGTNGGTLLTLGDLSDVDNSLPSNGDSLVYNTSTAMWVPGSASWASNLVGYAADSASFSSSISNNNINAVHITGTETITGAKTFSSTTTISLGTTLTNVPLIVTGSINGYYEINNKNNSSAISASSDIVVTANTGTSTTNFVDLGINSSGFTGNWGGALDGYLYASDGNLLIGTATAGKNLILSAGTNGASSSVIVSSGSIVVSQPFTNSSGRIKNVRIETTSYSLINTDHIIICNSSSSFSVTVPAASTNTNREYVIKNKGTGTITIDATGFGQIDGQNTMTLAQYATVTIVSDGTTWNKV